MKATRKSTTKSTRKSTRKSTIVSVALAAACGLAPTAGAQPDRNHGCAVLEGVVHATVLRSSSGTTAQAIAAGRPGPAVLSTCRDTARAVSSGYTRAMAERNVYLVWRWPDEAAGNPCLSSDLSQCHPRRNPFVPFMHGDTAFVAESWRGVLRAVGKTMPRGYAADLARFSAFDLSAALAAEIRRAQRGRTQQAYYTR